MTWIQRACVVYLSLIFLRMCFDRHWLAMSIVDGCWTGLQWLDRPIGLAELTTWGMNQVVNQLEAWVWHVWLWWPLTSSCQASSTNHNPLLQWLWSSLLAANTGKAMFSSYLTLKASGEVH